MSPTMAALAIHSSTDAAQVQATCHQFGLTVAEFRELHRLAAVAAESAYCPYSRFPVGSAVMTRYGSSGTTGGSHNSSSGGAGNGLPTVILGANVENASFPVGTCAERVALGRAVFEGHRAFKAIAVLALATTDVGTPASPCGMCRQFIREFCDLDMPILMFSKDGHYIAVKLELLLPLSFGPDSLTTLR